MQNPLQKRQLNYRSYLDSVKHMYDNPIAQTSTTAILTMVVIIFFGLAAIRPSLSVITKLQAEIKEKRELDAKLRSKVADLSAIQGQFLANQELLQVFERAVPPIEDVEKVSYLVEYVARRGNVKIVNYRASDIQVYGPLPRGITPGSFQELAVDLTLGGSYTDLINFFDTIQKLDRYFVADRVSFSQPSAQDVTYDTIMNIRLKMYWSPVADKSTPSS